MSKKTKRVRRGCHGGICACMGTCADIIEVPIDDPRPEYVDFVVEAHKILSDHVDHMIKVLVRSE